MQWVWDHEGRRFLDFFGGIATVGVGHCHPKVTEAVKGQLDTLWHTSALFLQSPMHEFAEKLAETMPGNLKVSRSLSRDENVALPSNFFLTFIL